MAEWDFPNAGPSQEYCCKYELGRTLDIIKPAMEDDIWTVLKRRVTDRLNELRAADPGLAHRYADAENRAAEIEANDPGLADELAKRAAAAETDIVNMLFVGEPEAR